MALKELYTGEFAIYTQELRAPKDDYTRRKIQKDIRKLEKILHALLDRHEVVMFYKDGDEEKMIIGTRIKPYTELELPESKLEEEVVNGKSRMVPNECCFFEMPSRKPTAIHFNDITKFMLRNENVSNILVNLDLTQL